MSLPAQLSAAWAALSAGRAEQALALTAQILARQPEHPDALQMHAGAALHVGRADLAADALRRAAALLPRQAAVHYNLGVAEQACGDHAAAAAAFRTCLALQPDNADALVGLAEAARANGAFDEAVAAYRQALARRPQDAAAAAGLALALADAGRGDEAERQARAAAEHHPRHAETWRALALVHERAGRLDAALAALAQGAARGADAFALAMSEGHLSHRAGALARAAAAFARALERQPASADAWNNLAACQVLLNRIDEAVASARQAVALAPDSAPIRMTLAAALSRSTEPAELDEALSLCRALIAAHPDFARAHDCAAIVLGKRREPAAAVPHAREAVRLAPDNGDYAVTLSRTLEQLGDLDGAQAVVEASAAHEAASASVLRQFGHIRLRRGGDGALAPLDRAWRREPHDQGGIAERAIALAQADGWSAASDWLGLREWVQAVDIAVPAPFADRAEFNRALAEDIRRHSRLRYEPVGLVARGGYLTGDLLADATPAITGFARSLEAAIAQYIAGLPDVPGHPFLGQVPRGERLMHVWATRVREQGVIDTHIHEGSWLSGAYYVELPPALGDADDAGWIEFGVPYAGLPAPPPEHRLRVRPRSGLMLFFPSYLFHRTLPYRGQGERISISFDLGPQ